MAGIETSRITTSAANDLTIQPAAGKKTLVKSVDSTNPGTTPVATAPDGAIQRLDINALQELSEADLDDDDLVMIQDISDGKAIKKSKVKNFGSGGSVSQPPFGDPLPTNGNWVDKVSTLGVKSGGNGSTNDLKNSVEFAVGNNTYNQSDKSITTGQTIAIRWISAKLNSATQGQTISGTLFSKTGSSFEQTWNLTIVKQPTVGWDLVDLADVPLSSAVTSAAAVPTGMNAPSPVTIDGGTLTSIQVSVNGGAFTSTPGNIESGQPLSVRGTTGASNTTSYTALISIGGLQRTWTVTTVGTSAAISTPSITSPANNSTGLKDSITAISSTYQEINGAGSHANSDWELKKAGNVVASSMASSTNKTSWAIPSSSLEEDTEYTIRVKYRSDTSVESSWSAESKFTTGSFVLEPGDPFGGGYFAGQISEMADGVASHNLIVSPRESAGLQGEYGGSNGGRGVAWLKPGITHDEYMFAHMSYGHINVDSLKGDPNYSAVYWVTEISNGPNAGSYDLTNATNSGIGGYNDWYIPAQYELCILYFFLKPSPVHNACANNVVAQGDGYNPHGVEPYTPQSSYTSDNPLQTKNVLFITGGGGEAFLAGTGPYWSSTCTMDLAYPHAPTPGGCRSQLFTDGGHRNTFVTNTLNCRTIRRIPV